jgi:hypothetical protein
MSEVSAYFAGQRNWGNEIQDESYRAFFEKVSSTIDNLDFKHSTKTGRKI